MPICRKLILVQATRNDRPTFPRCLGSAAEGAKQKRKNDRNRKADKETIDNPSSKWRSRTSHGARKSLRAKNSERLVVEAR